MEFYKVNVNGNEIQVADYPGEKGTIIAIHGLTGTHKNMHYYAEQFKADYRFISIDLRGRGNSAAADSDTSIFKHADDVLGLIEELKIVNPILLGYSMGAFISTIVASRLKSVEALILLDGAAKASEHQRGIVQPSLGRISREFTSKQHYTEEIQKIYANLGIQWNGVLQETAEYEVGPANGHWENKATESRIVTDFDSFYSFDPKEICQQIDCPVLLVYAEGNIGAMPPLFYLSDYDETQKHTKRIQTVVSDCNHYTMVFEKREEILQAVNSFLKEL
ncbi:pimeloyl-ACP methyl ester carboxylesterase [Planomicrobium stackebrandtii]|uniref:Pimeloyl-ACP methyl ester carboxylesterase n=1 Tax=Planomicrobium stackebrandtii TaxID=253160 RepID=A0ABU0GVG7_9BACL|nr:alpha/beta hydrolase [Planomicrobium stackebrandtii]MDQ0429342.1 pimeloyl-ACP methyl ester carboxylesterase [Planomicrobium stackebrandtii]